MTSPEKPSVLFVCVHNAGRSQMAAGYLRAFAGNHIDVFSAGSEPGAAVSPAAVAVMAEEGIDIAGVAPQILTTDAVREADVVITMGCGDACPVFPLSRPDLRPVHVKSGKRPAAISPTRAIAARVPTPGLRPAQHPTGNRAGVCKRGRGR
jgi:arsenate reductase